MMKILRSTKCKILVITAVLLMVLPLAGCMLGVGGKQQPTTTVTSVSPFQQTMQSVNKLTTDVATQAAEIQSLRERVAALEAKTK